MEDFDYDIKYEHKLCIPEIMFKHFFTTEEIDEINLENLIVSKPPMGDFFPPEIIMELGNEIFFNVTASIVFDVIKRFFFFLKNKYREENENPKPVLVLELNDFNNMSFKIKADLNHDNCDETIDKIQKIIDALKD